MTNSEKFREMFGIYAEEFWAYPKDKMLDWLQYDVPERNVVDTISRQAAIKLAIDLDYESRGILKESKCREIENRYNMIPSAEPQRWIPVSERLPEVGKFVLVTDIYLNDVDIMCKAEDSGWEDRHQNWSSFECVSAWCELPDPWKEGAE